MKRLNYTQELARYLALRESVGSPIYQIKPILGKFADYLNRHCTRGVRVSAVLDWVCQSQYSTATQHFRLSAARVFLRHLKTVACEVQIPSHNLIPRCHRPEPFIFSDAQILELLETTSTCAKKSISPLTLKTMFALMACTGLRPGEVMRLKQSDVFLKSAPPRLLVFRSKFDKSRWVPLHSTAAQALNEYIVDAEVRSDFFFSTKTGKAINRITLHRIFQQIIAQTSIRPREKQLRPTLHSLRHTFAVSRLRSWYAAGQDAQALLPNLSVYLGHVDPASSYWYLSCAPDLMLSAAQRFELYATTRGMADEKQE